MNKNNESNENNKKFGKEQFCKLVACGCIVLSVVSVGVMLNEGILSENEGIEGQVVSLSEMKKIEKDIINVKNYSKKGENPSTAFIGEYGGYSRMLSNGYFIQYSYISEDQNDISLEVKNRDNQVVLKKNIEFANSKESYIAYMDMKNDNELVLSILYSDNSNKETTQIVTYDLNGDILSELKMEGRFLIFDIDSSNNKVLMGTDEKSNSIKTLYKYDRENNKVFEHEFDEYIMRVYMQEDTTIVFTAPSYDNKKSNNNITIHKLDSKGDEVYSKRNEKLSNNNIYDMIQLSDGNFMVAETDMVDNDEGNGLKLNYIIKMDSEFNEIFRKEMNVIISELDILETNDGYFLVTTELYNVKGEDREIYTTSISKLNSSGENEWTKYIGYDEDSKIDVLEGNYVDIDETFIKDGKLKIMGSIFVDDMSDKYVELLIDDNGNISE